MPSMITTATARPSAGSSSKLDGSRMLSRVHSVKRDWGEDEKDETEIEWAATPNRIARKRSSPPPPRAVLSPSKSMVKSSYTGNVKDENGISAADRRRQAILAAMEQNAPSSTTSAAGPSSSSTAASSFSIPTPATLPVVPSSLRTDTPLALPPQQKLPDLREIAEFEVTGVKKRRGMPWEEEPTRKKSSSRTGSNESKGPAASESSSKGGTNIKQKICLSAEQQKVLQLVVSEGKNIFFTGSAGTGKSVLLREIIKNLKKKHVKAEDAVAITASTGIAACNIGGITLHSFGGAGLCLDKPEVIVGKIRKNKKAAARWSRTKVLIIDEISMVDAELFDKFNRVGQIIRKTPNKPFGGIQIVVTGDFFQLPPVTKGGAMPRFCFEADSWKDSIHMSVNLTKVFRQKDPRFVDMLNEMRFGRLTPQSIAEFRKLSRPIFYNDGIEPTELFPRREDVEYSNNKRMENLNADGWTYNATDGGAVTDPVQREKLLSNFMAPGSITLKIGAQVMLIKNLDADLVNGSMGIVIGFCHRQLFEVDPREGKWIEDGIVAGLEGEELERRLAIRQQLHMKVMEGSRPYPVVRFKITTPNAGYGMAREMLMEPDSFKTELPNGEIQVSRQQIPLILSWAMSIHKSQGQTLDRVKVNLSKVFEKGQAYVALSRATSLEGLQVEGFSADKVSLPGYATYADEKVMAHPKVAKWSATLKDLNI